jgi:hypothetical protein
MVIPKPAGSNHAHGHECHPGSITIGCLGKRMGTMPEQTQDGVRHQNDHCNQVVIRLWCGTSRFPIS